MTAGCVRGLSHRQTTKRGRHRCRPPCRPIGVRSARSRRNPPAPSRSGGSLGPRRERRRASRFGPRGPARCSCKPQHPRPWRPARRPVARPHRLGVRRRASFPREEKAHSRRRNTGVPILVARRQPNRSMCGSPFPFADRPSLARLRPGSRPAFFRRDPRAITRRHVRASRGISDRCIVGFPLPRRLLTVMMLSPPASRAKPVRTALPCG